MRSAGRHRLIVFGPNLQSIAAPPRHGAPGLADVSPAWEEMQRGVEELHAAEQLSVFAKTVPDQKGLLLFLSYLVSVSDLGSLMIALDYRGAPELLSMWLCVLSAPGSRISCLSHPSPAAPAPVGTAHGSALCATLSQLSGRVRAQDSRLAEVSTDWLAQRGKDIKAAVLVAQLTLSP